MKIRPSDSAWRELLDRLLDSAEEKPGGYKKLYFMEKMGFQDHTVCFFDVCFDTIMHFSHNLG